MKKIMAVLIAGTLISASAIAQTGNSSAPKTTPSTASVPAKETVKKASDHPEKSTTPKHYHKGGKGKGKKGHPKK